MKKMGGWVMRMLFSLALSPYLPIPLSPHQQALDVGDTLKDKIGLN